MNLTNPLRCVRLYGQAEKRIWWMPWQLEAMKDVVACDKPRGAGKRASIRGCPNGETHRFGGILTSINRVWRRTWGTEISQYPEE
jgi:hypothetical protein